MGGAAKPGTRKANRPLRISATGEIGSGITPKLERINWRQPVSVRELLESPVTSHQSPVTHSAITPSFRKSILIWQVSPHVVEIAVPGCTGGIVAHTAEEPELAIAVDPVRRIAAATRSPYLVRLIWA